MKEKCYLCGINNGVQHHHAIPRALKPYQNIIIPLCKGCHLKIHKSKIIPSFHDINTTVEYLSPTELYDELLVLRNLSRNLIRSNSLLVKEVNRIRNG
ncbi:MAG: hypothetical protein IMZ52_04790 [Actinobacteria bacterium]|nr:hypothetical protein [Actinomycetota bacterium]MBE3114783.1 hypothetical protein [Actinomycetota bacterium]